MLVAHDCLEIVEYLLVHCRYLFYAGQQVPPCWLNCYAAFKYLRTAQHTSLMRFA